MLEDKKAGGVEVRKTLPKTQLSSSECVSGYEIRILAIPEANGLRKRLFIKDKSPAH